MRAKEFTGPAHYILAITVIAGFIVWFAGFWIVIAIIGAAAAYSIFRLIEICGEGWYWRNQVIEARFRCYDASSLR